MKHTAVAKMPSSCLIFLLMGAFITCRPTTSKPQINVLRALNQEIQDHLNGIIEQSPVAQNLNTTTFHIPVLTKKEQCVMLRLKEFIKLLNREKIEDDKELNFHRLRGKLQDFDERSSLQQKSDHECETEEYLHRGFRKVLEDLRRLMRELYCIQEKC